MAQAKHLDLIRFLPSNTSPFFKGTLHESMVFTVSKNLFPLVTYKRYGLMKVILDGKRPGRKKIFGPSEKTIDSLRLSLFRGVGFEGKKLLSGRIKKISMKIWLARRSLSPDLKKM